MYIVLDKEKTGFNIGKKRKKIDQFQEIFLL